VNSGENRMKEKGVQERKNWMEERIKEINSGGNF
jgi:hypothetical protein